MPTVTLPVPSMFKVGKEESGDISYHHHFIFQFHRSCLPISFLGIPVHWDIPNSKGVTPADRVVNLPGLCIESSKKMQLEISAKRIRDYGMLDPKWSIYHTPPSNAWQLSWKMGQRSQRLVREDYCETLPDMIGQLHT